MEQHPFLALASTDLSPALTAARKRALWDELADLLNREGPAVRTADHWRHSWLQLCCRKRAEAARLRADQR
uniref:Regulatory protein zeste n=1 Tax=Amblyomma aureolatum TaxID=187763 RepID=A0A1E1WX09_9ACAR